MLLLALACGADPHVVDELTVLPVGPDVDEPADSRLRPDVARAMTIGVCAEHFPPGSVAREHVDAAIARYDEAPGVAIDIAVVDRPHEDQATLYGPDIPTTTVRLDYVYAESPESLPRGHHVGESCGDTTFLGLSVDSAVEDGALDFDHREEENEYSVVALNGECYDEDPDGDDVPLPDTIAHELGHVFGLPHINQHRDPYLRYSSIMNKSQGGESELTAYDLGYLLARYPGDAAELAAPDWRVSDWWLVEEERYAGYPWTEVTAGKLHIRVDNAGRPLDCETGGPPLLEGEVYDLVGASPDATLALRIEGEREDAVVTVWEGAWRVGDLDDGGLAELHVAVPLGDATITRWRLVAATDEAERDEDNNVGGWSKVVVGCE